jgi:hypothetical protein
MALVSALLAGFTALVVFLAGVAVGRATKRVKPNAPICSCTHGFGTHGKEGDCFGQIKRRANGYTEWVACRCVRYDGPEVVAGIWVPPIADGG